MGSCTGCGWRPVPIHDDHGKRAYTVGRISDIEEERRAQQELLEKAQRDSLTGLFNTAAGRQRSEELLAGLRGGNRDALILLDIDYFKEVNDRYGTAAATGCSLVWRRCCAAASGRRT